jgi:hypothetical protein
VVIQTPENTSVLVIAGVPGAGKSTLIEGLFHLMEHVQSPTLWMDTTLDGGILRKLKGECHINATDGASLYDTLYSLMKEDDTSGSMIDWQLAEAPYTISGLHEGLALYPNTSDTQLIQNANSLLHHPRIQHALAYGWPRLLRKNYRYVFMNAHNIPFLQFMLPSLPLDLLVLTTPSSSDDTFLLELLENQGHWHSRNILMTQAHPNQGLPNAWNTWVETKPHWNFLGRLPWFEQDADWQGHYLKALHSSLSRMNWDGVSVMKHLG